MNDRAPNESGGTRNRSRPVADVCASEPPTYPMAALDWLPTSLTEAAPVRRLSGAEMLFRQGDPTFAIFAVESGCIQLVRHATEDRTVILHSARGGELFAEAALFSDAYHCGAVAAVPTRLRIL